MEALAMSPGSTGALLLLAGLAVAVGLLGPRRRPETATPWSWRVDGGLALVAGLGGIGLVGLWLAPFHVVGGWGGTDLAEYCTIVAQLATGQEPTEHNRSFLAAWPGARAAALGGLLDGMALSSLGSLGLACMGLWLWGRAVHGRVAGLSAVLAAGALPPMLAASRDLSFYPEQLGVYGLAAGLVACSLRFGGGALVVLAAAAAGACFLVDLRGLVWGLPCAGLVLLAAAVGPPPSARPARMGPPRGIARSLPSLSGRRARALWTGSVLVVLAVAWGLGRVAYDAQVAPLERQADLADRLEEHGLPVPAVLAATPTTSYVWGRTSPLELPASVRELRRRSAAVPAELAELPLALSARAVMVDPWVPLGLASGVVALLGLVRGPTRLRRLAALLGPAAPFVVALDGALRFQLSNMRFLYLAAPLLAVLVGLAWATLAEGRTHREADRARVRPLLAVGLFGALVLGAVPTPLSPVAGWRTSLPTHARPLTSLLDGSASERARWRFSACAARLRDDAEAGLGGRLVQLEETGK